MELNSQYEHPEQFSLCAKVRDNLQDYIEGYLDALMMEAIRAHLSVCYLCQKEYNEIAETIRLVEGLPFAEPLTDFAPAIMAAIDMQSGHSFQAPVVAMEIEALKRLSVPRTTTGQQRQSSLKVSDLTRTGLRSEEYRIGERRRNGLTHVSPSDLGTYITSRERIMTALALLATIVGLLLHPWGRAAIGAQTSVANWFSGFANSLTTLPLIGGAFQFISNAVQNAGLAVSELWQSAGRVPLPVILFDAAVIAAAGWYFLNRRAISHARA